MNKHSSGQALVIILLVMAVALTIGLAVVSRSVTDIRLSQEQEESARAFSAAEAGIEAALGGSPITSYEGFTVSVVSEDLGGVGKMGFIFPYDVKKGDTQTVWLVDHDEDGNPDFSTAGNFTNFIFYWGERDVPDNVRDETPALEAYLVYLDGANRFQTRRVAFDPMGGRSEGFTSDAVVINPGGHSIPDVGGEFRYEAKFTEDKFSKASFPPANAVALRIKLLYNKNLQPLGVHVFGDPLPIQGTCHESTAYREETKISRKVKQCNLHKAPPGTFDYVLYSKKDLIKSD